MRASRAYKSPMQYSWLDPFIEYMGNLGNNQVQSQNLTKFGVLVTDQKYIFKEMSSMQMCISKKKKN